MRQQSQNFELATLNEIRRNDQDNANSFDTYMLAGEAFSGAVIWRFT
jgi:hypothetical protein